MELITSVPRQYTIIGAGLVGSLLAALLAKRGIPVRMFEARPDPRQAGFLGGRSINLALAERGLNALRAADLADEVLREAVMMRGRMVHDRDGATNLQAYGLNDSEVIWSVSRGGLNIQLLDAAETAGAELHFDQRLIDADLERKLILVQNNADEQREVAFDVLIGADGAGSALRGCMDRSNPLGQRTEPLLHGYKELEIPSANHGSSDVFSSRFAMEPNALHIWPRGGYMCIALPNRDGSYTVTLFLAESGTTPSFADIPDASTARTLFESEFADVLALMPTFDADFAQNPTGTLATLYLDRWHSADRALLIGDAAHAIVPFHGQGMNAGFEDAAELAPMLADAGDDLASTFTEFQCRRKPNTDAIAAMAIENYVEMRDSVADPRYLLKRDLVRALSERCPDHFMSRYRMVSFTHLPYAYCFERSRQQDALLTSLLHGHDQLDQVDLNASVARVHADLPPLPH